MKVNFGSEETTPVRIGSVLREEAEFGSQSSVICNSSSRGVGCFWPLLAPALTHPHPHTGTDTWLKEILKKRKEATPMEVPQQT